jgi:GxxExxY protein
LDYKGLIVGAAYRADLLVGNKLLVELKAIDRLLPVHKAQLVTYLRLMDGKLGLLINFNVTVLKNGIQRVAFNL